MEAFIFACISLVLTPDARATEGEHGYLVVAVDWDEVEMPAQPDNWTVKSPKNLRIGNRNPAVVHATSKQK